MHGRARATHAASGGLTCAPHCASAPRRIQDGLPIFKSFDGFSDFSVCHARFGAGALVLGWVSDARTRRRRVVRRRVAGASGQGEGKARQVPVRLLVLFLVVPQRTSPIQEQLQLCQRLLYRDSGHAARLQLLQPLPPKLVQLLRQLRPRVWRRCRARERRASALR